MSAKSIEGSFSRWWILLATGIIISAGLLTYHNSFGGPFIFDGTGSIIKNSHIRQLWPIWQVFQAEPGWTVAGRPVLSLSLALNYQISGLDVWSYHAVNLAVHILAALTLFGIVRRTLLSERLRERFGQVSFSLALICALIWLVHPLQTGSVTYIVQRAESLMGLFYLLSLYCAIRGFSSAQNRRWYSLAILACALGMGTKEVMATAPFMVLLYDRIFVSRSFKKEVFTRRWGLHVGLAATWLIFGGLAFFAPRGESVGFDYPDLTGPQYAITQCKVIVSDYLKLSFWPHPLVLDYGWPIVKNFSYVVPHALVLVVLLVATLAALHYYPAWGFLGVWFFVILAPSSSIVPIITEVAAEHRMYLPLAAVVVAVVLGGYVILVGLVISDKQRRLGRALGYILAVAVIVTLGLLTFGRNCDYASEFSIWDATVRQCPDNHRAYNNRGNAYARKGDLDKAIADYDQAIRSKPKFAQAYHNRGNTYLNKGEVDKAIADYDQAIRSKPNFAEACNNLAFMLATHPEPQLRDGARAVRLAERACELGQYKVPAHVDTLAAAYAEVGQFDKAVETAQKAIQLVQTAKNEELAKDMQSRLELYKANRPHRESFSSKGASSLKPKKE